MPKTDALTQGSDVLAPLIAALLEQLTMASRGTKVLRATKRKFPRKFVRAEVSPEVLQENLAFHRSGKCRCGCGADADRNSRGLSLRCYDVFRQKKSEIKAKRGVDKSLAFDEHCQLEGKIFPPHWNPDSTFATAKEEWEAKQRQLEQAAKGGDAPCDEPK